MVAGIFVSIGYTPVTQWSGYAKVCQEAMICIFEIFHRKQTAY